MTLQPHDKIDPLQNIHYLLNNALFDKRGTMEFIKARKA